MEGIIQDRVTEWKILGLDTVTSWLQPVPGLWKQCPSIVRCFLIPAQEKKWQKCVNQKHFDSLKSEHVPLFLAKEDV